MCVRKCMRVRVHAYWCVRLRAGACVRALACACMHVAVCVCACMGGWVFEKVESRTASKQASRLTGRGMQTQLTAVQVAACYGSSLQ